MAKAMGAKTQFICRCCGDKSEFSEADLDMCTPALPETTLWILDAPLVELWKYGRKKVEAGEHYYFNTIEEIDAEYYRLCSEGKDVQYETLPRELDDVCDGCRYRGELCQHNFRDHEAQGAHSSRPHWDGAGAADPATCPYCRDSSGAQKGIPPVTNRED